MPLLSEAADSSAEASTLLSASEFLESSDLLIVTEATFFLEDFSLSSADFSFSDFVSSAFSGSLAVSFVISISRSTIP